jgi:hypothetical protein
MALEIITRKVKRKRHIAFDLEWVPGSMKLRLIGVFDPEGGYRAYQSVENFFNNEFCHKNRGKWFYAHFGGRFDSSFFVDFLVRNKVEARFAFSGSMAVMIKIVYRGMRFTLVDSGRLYPTSLKKIGESIGMLKAGPENEDEKEDFFANSSLLDLMYYNQRDVEILWHGIEEFQTRILAFGSDMQMSLASTAMTLFRRKYLKQNINTDKWVNDRAREAYFASRVEVFQRKCDYGHMYDINSSFPYAMTFPCPGVIEKIRNRGTGPLMLPVNPDSIYIAEVEFSVPDEYLTPVPYRHEDGRVFFPTGRWRQWLTSIDIQELEKVGGVIYDVFHCIHFNPFSDLSAYAEDLYDKRKKATDETDKYIYKLLLNSLYGKFAESDEKQAIIISPTAEQLSKLGEENEIMPGVYLAPEIAEVPHVHVPIAAHITAIARRTLYESLDKAGDIYYCDTDSIVTTGKLEESKELGGLKLECSGSGTFIQPKVYTFGDKVKAKGFSLGKVNPKERFETLVAGGEVAVNLHMSLKQMFRKGILEPRELKVVKRLQHSRPKRKMDKNGNSIPWTIEELKSGASA